MKSLEFFLGFALETLPFIHFKVRTEWQEACYFDSLAFSSAGHKSTQGRQVNRVVLWLHLVQQRYNVNYVVLSMFGIDISIRFNYRRRHYFHSEGSVNRTRSFYRSKI